MRYLLLLLAGCQVDRHVTLELGPDENSVTHGFTCMDPQMPQQLVFQRALTGKTLDFYLVVDVIDVGSNVPSCLAEDVVATCADGHCQVSVADAPTRFCGEVKVDVTDAADAPRAVTTYLANNFPTVIQDAPHHPVIVRAVATTEPCTSVTVASAGTWSTLTSALVLGCAYSCPLDLDDANGTVSLGINIDLTNATPAECLQVVDECATFPN
jgi:hypothetical protein